MLIPISREGFVRGLRELGKQRGRGFTAKNSTDDLRSWVRLVVTSGHRGASLSARTKVTESKFRTARPAKIVSLHEPLDYDPKENLTAGFHGGKMLSLLVSLRGSNVWFSYDETTDFLQVGWETKRGARGRVRFVGKEIA